MPQVEQKHNNEERCDFFQEIGLTSEAKSASIAVLLGGRRLLAHHLDGPSKLQIRYKADGTAVSVADEQSETVMTKSVRQNFPKALLYGEEYGVSGDRLARKRVIFDPLDGSNPYINNELFSTVGLAVREPIPVDDTETENDDKEVTTTSAVCLPFEKTLMVAQRGKGAWKFELTDMLTLTGKEPKRMSVSSHNTIEQSIIYLDANYYPENRMRKHNFQIAVENLSPDNPLSYRMICSNINQQAKVADGDETNRIATLTDCVGFPGDLYPGGLLIAEAGGKFTDIYGNPVTDETQVAIGSNGIMHEILLQAAQPFYANYPGFVTNQVSYSARDREE